MLIANMPSIHIGSLRVPAVNVPWRYCGSEKRYAAAVRPTPAMSHTSARRGVSSGAAKNAEIAARGRKGLRDAEERAEAVAEPADRGDGCAHVARWEDELDHDDGDEPGDAQRQLAIGRTRHRALKSYHDVEASDAVREGRGWNSSSPALRTRRRRSHYPERVRIARGGARSGLGEGREGTAP